MACGCLVITYGNVGSNEIIYDKETGYIVPQGEFITKTVIIREIMSDSAAYRKPFLTFDRLLSEGIQ